MLDFLLAMSRDTITDRKDSRKWWCSMYIRILLFFFNKHIKISISNEAKHWKSVLNSYNSKTKCIILALNSRLCSFQTIICCTVSSDYRDRIVLCLAYNVPQTLWTELCSMEPPTQCLFWSEGRQKWAGSSMLRRHHHIDKLYWVANRWIHHEDLCHIPLILPHQVLGAAILSKEQTPFYLSQSGLAQAHFATVCLTHSQCFGNCREQIWFPEAPPGAGLHYSPVRKWFLPVSRWMALTWALVLWL